MFVFRELKRRNVFRVAIAYAMVGWFLAEVGALLFETFEAPGWVMKVFATVIVLGFPLALFFAWAYELTAEGLKREAEVDRSQSDTNPTGRKVDYLIMAVLILALAYFAVDKFVLDPARDAELAQATTETATQQAQVVGESAARDKSIAVLPFVNMSDDAGNEYFSDGISEEILNALARVKDLKVAGRTSSFAFKGRNEDLRTIGEALGVSHILEGSVRKAGAQVRITAQLVKADDGFHLWSETYDRELMDIFAIQDEIAHAILDQLKTHLSTDQPDIQFSVSRTDVSAFDLYLEAKQKIYLRRKAPLEQAAELLERAVAIDPGYAPAFAQYGVTLMLLAENHYGTLPVADSAARAQLMFEQALSLDPASAEALAGLGMYYSETGEQERSIEILRRALSINPNLVNATNWLSNSLMRLGYLEEATRIRQENLVRDPLYLPGINNALDDYMLTGDIEQAQALMNRVRPFMPASRTMIGWEGVLHFVAGEIADSLPYFESSHEMEPENPTSRGQLSRALLYSWQYERLAATGLDEFRVYALIHLERPQEALELARKLAADDGEPALIRVLAAQERYAQLIRYVESRWPDLQAFEADYPERDGWSEHNYLGLIAFAYQRLGNKEKFEEAVARFKAALDYQRQNGANNHPFAFAEAVYAVLVGDHETALGRLARAFEGGFNGGPDLSETWPMFEALHGDQRYTLIVDLMVEHVHSERAKLGLASIGDNYRPPQLSTRTPP